jgi:spermidine synthase
MYLANILGSTAGSLLTGFVLMDHLTMAQISIVLALLGLGIAAALHARSAPGRGRGAGWAGLAAAALLLLACGGRLFDGLYEKLQFHGGYSPAARFAHVVETKSGVITVTKEGRIFGGGIYDGAYNTSLREKDDINTVIRPYALAEIHPAPREALMIGLSSGSWATIVANNPAVEHLTVVEINAGYLKLLPRYPAVRGLLSNPKVRIEIDDGRRWLVRNRDRRFDLIVSNTTFHWRSNASNLLSTEFLELVRTRLREGGVFFYNTTGSRRVAYTGARVFRHALRLMHFLAVSDSPIPMDLGRLKRKLWTYPWEGGTVLDRSHPGDEERLNQLMADLARQLERDDSLRAPAPYGRLITDDNMGTEWEETP